MHRAADLLVEERVANAVRHARVVAEGELAEETRARVQFKHAVEECLSLARRCLDYFALAEDQPHPLDGDAVVCGGDVELDHAVGAVLDRPGEELAAGEVALAIAVDEDAPVYGERQVG